MQRGDLVVELLTRLVEAPPAAGGDLLRQTHRNRASVRFGRLGEAGGELEHVERAPPIAVGRLRDELDRLGLGPELCLAQPPLPVGERAVQERGDVRLPERLEHVHPGPGEQRAHDLERGILGRGAHEGERAVLQIRQERVLLRLVESMHLVQKKQRRAPARCARRARRLHRRPDVLDTRHHRREGDELRVGALGDEPRQGRLARAGRPPEDERVRASRFERLAQRLAGGEQVSLPDHLTERAGAHAVGERPQALGRGYLRGAHLAGVPITSTPGGGENVSSFAGTAPLTSM